MTTLTKEQLDIDNQEAPIDNLGEEGIKIDGKGEDENADNGKGKGAVGRSRIHEFVKYDAATQRNDRTRDDRNHLLAGREGAALTGINEGVGPSVNQGRYKIVTEIA